jgi:hypothetical protein
MPTATLRGRCPSIVTSTAQNDSGMFETNLRDERFLPFEGAGAESTWRLELPSEFRQFDYNTIADVILHLGYTARQGGDQLRQKAVEQIKQALQDAKAHGLVQLFSLKHDFPSEWHRFVTGDEAFKALVKKEYFPYFVQGEKITIDEIQLHAIQDGKLQSTTPQGLNLAALNDQLADEGAFELPLGPDDEVLEQEAVVFMLIRYSIS